MIFKDVSELFKYKRRRLKNNVLLNKVSQLTIVNKRAKLLTNKKRL